MSEYQTAPVGTEVRCCCTQAIAPGVSITQVPKQVQSTKSTSDDLSWLCESLIPVGYFGGRMMEFRCKSAHEAKQDSFSSQVLVRHRRITQGWIGPHACVPVCTIRFKSTLYKECFRVGCDAVM